MVFKNEGEVNVFNNVANTGRSVVQATARV